MSIIGIWDTKELDEFIDKLKGLSEEKIQEFHEDAIKQVAAMTLAKLITATPVGDYPENSGKTGGTLRRGWTNSKVYVPKDKKCNIADAFVYIANDIDVIKKGRTYIIILSNPVNYASYVEYGHRTVNGRWVEGQYFVKVSEDEMQKELPVILEKKLNDFLGEYFNE